MWYTCSNENALRVALTTEGSRLMELAHMNNDTTSKPCSKCGEVKPLDQFHKDKKSPDGHKPTCKSCRCAYQNAFRWEHRDEDLAKKKIWWAEHRDEQLIRLKKYREDHKDELAVQQKAYRQSEQGREVSLRNRRKPEAVARRREYDKRYRVNNVEKRRAWHRKYACENVESERLRARRRQSVRRAQKHRSEGQYTAQDVEIQMRSQKSRCWHCGKQIGKDWHIDHLIPLARGGSNDARNIVISCPKCNLSKGAKLPQEWNGRLF